ncbi:uncharacterized protein LOC114290005 [Camellia sinensis]|uniref:High chlorophyll fluorescence 153 n=1 Tax=Camellia sinensis var. sinensis TaxID=542762 RepID=A0A4S4DPB7_CAMSN|nr:uncharacterized protein LOC114290005 [Camellia sinensis]THG04869.1 hypothetical protein TEA_010110 [Camellia sinensis var. sinensis]
MASVGIILCNYSAITTPTLHFGTPKSTSTPLRRLVLNSPSIPISLRKTIRGLSVVTRAGPGTGTYIFAFVLPLSLLAVTVFTASRIADKLDRDFLQEMAINEAIMEAADDDGDDGLSLEEKSAVPRTRNRPKREAETSSM